MNAGEMRAVRARVRRAAFRRGDEDVEAMCAGFDLLTAAGELHHTALQQIVTACRMAGPERNSVVVLIERIAVAALTGSDRKGRREEPALPALGEGSDRWTMTSGER